MAHHKSAIKRIRKSRKQRLYNRGYKKLTKEAIRSVQEATTFEQASENLKKAHSILDKVVAKGVLHKNASANRKSHLAKFVNSLKNKEA